MLKPPDVLVSTSGDTLAVSLLSAQGGHGTFEPVVLDLEPSLADVPPRVMSGHVGSPFGVAALQQGAASQAFGKEV